MERSEFIRRLFERARALDPEAQCEAYFSQTSEFEAEQRQGELVNYSVSDGGGLGFRVLTKGRMGYASTQILDEEAVEQLVGGAMENAAPSVKAAADAVVGSNLDAGLGKEVLRLLAETSGM